MSDDWTPYSDTQLDHQSDVNQLLALSDRLSDCAEKLSTKGYTKSLSEEISNKLLQLRPQLAGLECGLQFAKDLAVVNQLVASQADHRSVGVLRYCLQCLTDYLADVAEHGVENPIALLTAFNELFAIQKKPLLTENLFSIPNACRIDVNALQSSDQSSVGRALPDKYLEFSQTMLGIYRGENREQKLIDLAQAFDALVDKSSGADASSFWRICAAFASTVKIPKGELSPALFKLFKEIEGVLFFALGDKQSPVLGMQQKVDHLLVNLLCYIPVDQLPDAFVGGDYAFAGMQQELLRLHQATPDKHSPWLQTSVRILAERLQHCAAILSEEALNTDESIIALLAEVGLLKRILILIGVRGARGNLDEVESFLRKGPTRELMQSGYTSVQLVEQQMLYQFDFLRQSTDSLDRGESKTLFPAASDAFTSDTDQENRSVEVMAPDAATPTPNLTSRPTPNPTPEDFVARCNLCIDVIQQSLDTALGSSGNLIPDNSVVTALSKLIDLVSIRRIDELSGLLQPLSKLLTAAEDSTLNQSETLLVQEAIIAATMGIDSLVGLKPMPDMVADVTTRVEEVLQTTTRRLTEGPARNIALSSFLTEAGELVPRLFELFQRLRGAPDGASRLYGDINRLLHAFKMSADEANEQQLAELAHTLEATMVDLTQSDAPASQRFFDIAIESVECLDEDIERLRNSESVVDRSDLIDRLKLEGAIDDSRLDSIEVQPKQTVVAKQSLRVPSAPDKTPQSNVVLLTEVDASLASINWSERFRQIEACYSAINHSHKQLLDLKKRTSRLVNTIVGERVDPANESSKALQSLSEQLQQIADNQNIAVRQLDNKLGSASMLDVAALGKILLSTIEIAADKRGLNIQFAFEPGCVSVHRRTYDQLKAALPLLLDSIVTHAIPESTNEQRKASDNSASLPSSSTGSSTGISTVAVRVQQTERNIIIDVIDNGCGVVVQGDTPRSNNPWANVARPDWREIDDLKTPIPPQAWSKQSQQVVNINGLLKVASSTGGTVAIKSDEEQTCYRLCLPVPESTQTVILFEVYGHDLAIPVSRVESVGFAGGQSVKSLGGLLGLKPQSVLNKSQDEQTISIRTASELLQFSVGRVVGHRTLKFTAAERVLPDVPGYLGVSVSVSGQLIMLLDMDYWSSQQH